GATRAARPGVEPSEARLMSKRLAILLLALLVFGCAQPADDGPGSDRTAATRTAAERKGTSAKTREAGQALKADLTTFEVSIFSFPPKGRGGESDAIGLVTDPKKVQKGKRVFAISEKQAVALIDYRADEGLFDRVSVPPPGILPPGWYVSV